MYMVTTAARMSSSSLASDARKASAAPWKLRRSAAERGARGEIEGDRRRGKLAEVIHREQRRLFCDRGDRAQGHLRARGGSDVDVLQRVRAPAELRLHLEHHPVLIGLREDGGDQPLPEGVVERGVDRRGRDAQAPRG